MREELKVSVIICTYNPVERVFVKCLQHIYEATSFSKVDEIIIVDNNSDEPVNKLAYIKRFLNQVENMRIVTETKQGLTPARLRGIKESTGDLLVFVDDDNFLDRSYFGAAKQIIHDYPFIGAFSGQIFLEYDAEPPSWTRRYWGMLTYKPLSKDIWSNIPFNTDTMPNGAGLCVTRDTAWHYHGLFESGKRTFQIDRTKKSLLSGGDNDLAMCACDIGKGMGLFQNLRLTHYMAANRFTLEYLTSLAYGIYYSYGILLFMREGKVKRPTMLNRLKAVVMMNLMTSKDRKIYRATRIGFKDAVEFIRSRHESA